VNIKIKVNQRPLNLAIVSAMVLGLTALTVPAYAIDTAANLTVSADINPSCTISATDLNFGAYDPVVANATQDLATSATISTTCTLGATVKVIMDNGLHSTTELRFSGRMMFFTDYRHMSNAVSGSKLQYDLYTNENHTTVWNASNFREVVGTGTSEDLTVFGKVFKNQQDAAAGSYTDTVSIGVIY